MQAAEAKQPVPIKEQLDKYALQVAAEGLEIESTQVFSVQVVAKPSQVHPKREELDIAKH